jgi:hypothetical protein
MATEDGRRHERKYLVQFDAPNIAITVLVPFS